MDWWHSATRRKLDNIRVTYSGLMGFAVAMGSMLAGLIFIIIVTRQLEPEEFGAWAVIGSMTTYSLTTSPIISYWTTRQVARGKQVGRTSMVSTSFFAGGSIPVYVLSVYLFSNIESAFLDSMFLGVILVPVLFIEGILSAINLGHKPHAVSIGMAAFQFLKIPAGFVLVFFLGLGLDGAILAIFIAHLSNIAVQLRYARPRLAVRLDFVYLRMWIKQAWIPLYVTMHHRLRAFDIVVYTVIADSVIGVAYYAAGMAVSHMVNRAGRISQALYPKLLAEGSRNHITENFTWVMYFTIPLLVLAVLFSKHAMFILNPEYAEAWMVGVLLALGTFVHVIMTFCKQVLTGTDTVDVETPTATELLKSRLFLTGTIGNAYIITYLAVLTASLYVFRNLPELELVTLWSSIMLTISAPFLLYYVVLVRKHAPFRVPYGHIMRHVTGGAGMVTVFLLTNEHIVTFEVSIYLYLPGLLLELAICCATYLGITYAIDYKTRKLVHMILSEVVSYRKHVD